MNYEKKYYGDFNRGDYDYFLLSGDVGGTNTSLGISGVKESPELLFSFHFESQKLKNLVEPINKILKTAHEKHGIEVNNACIGAAGPVMDHKTSKLTNLGWGVDANEILSKTLLGSVIVLNDFEAIGYGINLLDHNDEKDVVTLIHKKHNHVSLPSATKAIIGAGTGLGKSILVFDSHVKAYVPVASEGGHGDFPVYTEQELKLADHVMKAKKGKGNFSYEDVLSGHGLENIYSFLRDSAKSKQTKYTKEIGNSKNKAVLISKYRKKDKTCKESFDLFTQFYARCAKNFALDALALGGVYVAGGIAAKNSDIFKKQAFIKEFERNTLQQKLLQQIPVFVIVNYEVSLYGASLAAVIRQDLATKNESTI